MLDNEEAEIVVGQNVPFVTGSQQTTGGLANPFQTIERQDVGLTLKVKPQINEGNAIKLDITQEVSSVAPASTTGASDIITNKRSIKTSVLADDGDVVVLGGLIRDDLQEGISKVPLLGDIPVMGNLFRSRNVTKVKRNLMVFLHPVIMRDAKANAAFTGRKYNYIRAQQIQSRQDGVHLLPDDVAPVLPPLDEFLVLPPAFEQTAPVQQGDVN
jgi:general secretion pathway protein D